MTDHLRHKADFLGLQSAVLTDPDALERAAPNLAWHGCHPFGDVTGGQAVEERFWRPLRQAFPDLQRRDDIVIAGRFETGDWVAATGHLAGTWKEEWLGFGPTRRLAFLRYGEFWRYQDGRPVEARVVLDLVEVLRQCGRDPLPPWPGAPGLSPAPQTGDGVRLVPADPAETQRSLELVEAMLFGGLRAYDGADLRSMGMERYWHPGMMWYGPGGIGSNRGIDGFQRDHQRPFLEAFPDRVGGNHRARIAEGNYVASTGWPSLRATHRGAYLGVPATERPVTMTVMDWWRRDGGLLAENWVFIDMPALFLQLGRDLLAEARQAGAACLPASRPYAPGR